MVHPDKPLSKSAKQRRMTSLISRYLVVVECPLLVIRLFCPLLRPQEDVLVRRQHRNDRQHLLHWVKVEDLVIALAVLLAAYFILKGHENGAITGQKGHENGAKTGQKGHKSYTTTI